MGTIYSVQMNKGGVGKTSLVTNLAGAISRDFPNKKVLIIDTDAQGNSAMAFGLKPTKIENTMYEVFVNKKDIKDTIISLEENLFLAPSNETMNFLEFDVLTNLNEYKNPFFLLKNAIEKIKNEYDYIFIDTPPSLGLVAGNVLCSTDGVIIPFAPESFAINGVLQVIERIEEFKERFNPDLKISGVIGMMMDKRTSLHGEVLQQCRKYCYERNINMFNTVIPKSIRFANSTAYQGKPAVFTDAKNEIVSSYFNLLKEILKNE